MTDDSTFGSGLNTGGVMSGAAMNTGGSTAGGDADFQPTPPPASPVQPPASGGIFGTGLQFSGPPKYTAPDPSASPLDQTADTLKQRIQRANSVATNPLLQFFDPEGVMKARNFVPAATEELQKIEQQKATQAAGRTQAVTLGLAPGEVSDQATDADRLEAAKARALKGDLRAFQGISAVNPQAAAAIQDQVHQAASAHLDNAQYVFDSLSNMRNQGQYAAKINELRQSGKLGDLEALGYKLPDTFDKFNASRAQESEQLRQARVNMEALSARIQERTNGTPMEEKEAKTYEGRLTTAYGDTLSNGNWERINGKRVFVVNGMGDINDLGKKYSVASADQRKSVKEGFDAAVPKEDMEKYRAQVRTYQLATTDAKGNKLADGKINTNPNVQQGIAEGLASLLRGGSGGANVGLLKIELAKRGWAQGAIDGFISNYNGALNTMFADANRTDKPYLSAGTQKQIRDVLDVLKTYNDKNIGDRASQVAERAGALGLDASALGFGKGEAAGAVQDALDRGRQSTIARFTDRARATGGGDGGIYLDNPPPHLVTDHPTTPQNTQPLPAAVTPQPDNRTAVLPAPGGPSGGGGGTPPGQTGTGQPPQGPGGVPPTTGPTPGRYGLPPNMPLNSPQALTAAANRSMQIESGFKQGQKTGSYRGLAQWSDEEMRRHGITDPDNVDQNRRALIEDIQVRAAKLQAAGLPATASNVYLMHQQGEAGAMAHLKAPDATAWQNVRQYYKSDAVAKQAIWGNMTPAMRAQFPGGVDTVKSGDFTRLWQARYDGTDNKAGGSVVDAAGRREGLAAQSRTAPRAFDTSGLPDVGAAAWTGRTTPAGDRLATPQERASGPVVENAPAIGSTVGAIGGSAAGPFGSAAGGGIGGGAGQAFKDYMQGRPQDPVKIAKATALGTVLGIAPEGAPLVGAGARIGGAAAVDAGATALEGGSGEDIATSGLEGGAYALGGEVLGRFLSALGPTAHKVLSNYTTPAQKEISEMAGKLSEARKTLETTEPKIAGVGGAAAMPNPKYEAAKNAEEAAVAYMKAHNQNPDDMVYAYDQAKAGVSAGEAATMRRANTERADVGKGYEGLRQDVQNAGVGAPKPNQPVPNGPMAQLRTAANPTGSVPAKFQPEAEHAEMLIKAPAKNFGEKWQQLQDAGSELVQKRMDFLQAGDKSSAEAMDGLFEGVRNQQKAVAEYVFGEARGKEVISNLENLDKRYAKVMSATQGMNFQKMQSVLAGGNTPEARELEKNFTEFAKGDPTALRAFNAMKAGAKGNWKSEASLMVPIIAGEVATNMGGVPTMGAISALVGGHRLYKLAQGYMNARLLGKAVTFKDFMSQEIQKGGPDLVRQAVQRGATMQ